MEELYFDGAATTPMLPQVSQAFADALSSLYGNPSSLHRKGVEAQRAIAIARAKVQRALGATGGRIVFTSGGTEANNLALLGTASRFGGRGRHLVTTQIEHPSVGAACSALERAGWRITRVAPRTDGQVEADDVLSAVGTDTTLVSVMHVNNETGAALPIAEIGRRLSGRPRPIFHVDGVQAFGKVSTALGSGLVDLYTVSAHKIGGPKGVGALWLRERLTIDPILFGGGQEGGLRSGTENVAGIVALGEAARLAGEAQQRRLTLVERLSARLCAGLTAIDRCRLNRSEQASPYIVNASFRDCRGEVLVRALADNGLYVSTGSACSTRGGQARDSHVLTAMRLSGVERQGSVRFSLGWWNDEQQIDHALRIVGETVAWLRSIV